jgi:hypothetical protein
MSWLIGILIAALGFGGLALLATQIGRLRKTPEQAARLIDLATQGSITQAEWEAFLNVRQLDPRVDEARLDCAGIADKHGSAAHPPLGIGRSGSASLREVADRLRQPE